MVLWVTGAAIVVIAAVLAGLVVGLWELYRRGKL